MIGGLLIWGMVLFSSMSWRAALVAGFAAVLLAVLAVLYIYPAAEPGLATTWERTISTQVGRESPVSI